MSLNTVDAIQEILQRPPSDDWRSLLASAIHDVRDKVGAEVARSLWKEKILKSPKYQRRRGKHQRQVQEYLDIRKELQQQRISAVYYTRFEVLGAYTSSFSREDWESLFSFIAQRLRERSLVVFPYSDAAILTKFFHLDKRDTTFHTFLNSQRKSDLQKKTITGKRVLEQLTMYWDELGLQEHIYGGGSKVSSDQPDSITDSDQYRDRIIQLYTYTEAFQSAQWQELFRYIYAKIVGYGLGSLGSKKPGGVLNLFFGIPSSDITMYKLLNTNEKFRGLSSERIERYHIFGTIAQYWEELDMENYLLGDRQVEEERKREGVGIGSLDRKEIPITDKFIAYINGRARSVGIHVRFLHRTFEQKGIHVASFWMFLNRGSDMIHPSGPIGKMFQKIPMELFFRWAQEYIQEIK